MAMQREPRNFLNENKLNVHLWERRNRMMNTNRLTLWRPVILRYPEPLRPHGERRYRYYNLPTYEKSGHRAGLARPYGFDTDDRVLIKRALGGDDDNNIKDNLQQLTSEHAIQTDEILDKKFLKTALTKCHHSTTEKKSSGALSIKKNSKFEEDKKSKDIAINADEGDEAPLSARSSKSLKSIRSTCSRASMASKASTRTQCSRKSITSNKSHVSRASRKTNLTKLDDNDDDEFLHPHLMNEAEREKALHQARQRYTQIISEYNRLPVAAGTLRVRNRKIAIEKELAELDANINMFANYAAFGVPNAMSRN